MFVHRAKLDNLKNLVVAPKVMEIYFIEIIILKMMKMKTYPNKISNVFFVKKRASLSGIIISKSQILSLLHPNVVNAEKESDGTMENIRIYAWSI
jgi:hypothetical protein